MSNINKGSELLLKEYIRGIIEAQGAKFRNPDISYAESLETLREYIRRLKNNHPNKKTVKVPIVSGSRPRSLTPDQESLRVLGMGSNVSNIKTGDPVTWDNPGKSAFVELNMDTIDNDWVMFTYVDRSGKNNWSALLKDKAGSLYPIHILQKSGYFSGKNSGSKLKKEDIQVAGLSESLNAILLKMKEEDPSSPDWVTLRIPGLRRGGYKVTGVEQRAAAKADFFFTGINDNHNVYVSLKDGASVKSFQQYGGVTRDYSDHPTVVKFAYLVYNMTCSPDEIGVGSANTRRRLMSSGSEVYMDLNPSKKVDKDLILKCMYGRDAVDGDWGLEKCHMILQVPASQAKLNFIKRARDGSAIVEPEAAHMLVYPEIPKKSDPYYPVLMARRDNSTKIASLGPFSNQLGVRILVYPKGKLGGTAENIHDELKDAWTTGPYAQSIPNDIGSSAYSHPSCQTESYDLIKRFVNESLLIEELTKADKKEIQKLAKKESEKQIKKLVMKMIQDEIKKELKGKDLEKSIVDITKKVLQGWHDLLYRQKNIIDRVKI